MSIDKTNKQQLQAYELIETTNSSFFLTGKAGTGKTTFLQTVQKEIDKNFIYDDCVHLLDNRYFGAIDIPYRLGRAYL